MLDKPGKIRSDFAQPNSKTFYALQPLDIDHRAFSNAAFGSLSTKELIRSVCRNITQLTRVEFTPQQEKDAKELEKTIEALDQNHENITAFFYLIHKLTDVFFNAWRHLEFLLTKRQIARLCIAYNLFLSSNIQEERRFLRSLSRRNLLWDVEDALKERLDEINKRSGKPEPKPYNEAETTQNQFSIDLSRELKFSSFSPKDSKVTFKIEQQSITVDFSEHPIE
ncbi:hypothetical protein GF406_09800, partial [candidate division KSB1 bacterium]|nr:hypothetical protein [candidate division KSB1 bacterium]